jgi:hypothetical protein
MLSNNLKIIKSDIILFSNHSNKTLLNESVLLNMDWVMVNTKQSANLFDKKQHLRYLMFYYFLYFTI